MSTLDSEIAALPTFSAHELRVAWRGLRCGDPTAGSSRDLMLREIAYKMQERAHGGLAPAIRRRLRALAEEIEANGAEALASVPLLNLARGYCANGEDARTPSSCLMTASNTKASDTNL